MLVEVVVVGLAAYRLWRLLAVDSITARLRDRLNVHAIAPVRHFLAEMVACPWCLGTWCAVAVGLAAYFAGLTSETPWLVVPAAAVVCGWLGDHL